MDVHARKGWTARLTRGCSLAVSLLVLMSWPASARDREPFAARAGLDMAQSAAKVWAEDAVLVYVENDESVVGTGRAERWGYLFFSPASQRSRAYSIREGRVIEAEEIGRASCRERV